MGRQIRDHTEHHLLNAGDLVLTATGELRRVAKYRPGLWRSKVDPNAPEETSLEHWATDYAITLADTGATGDGADKVFPLTVVQLAAPGGVSLTEDERGYLAMHARYESERETDPRYWHPDPTVRAERLRRWREIADWLHPDPYGQSGQEG